MMDSVTENLINKIFDELIQKVQEERGSLADTKYLENRHKYYLLIAQEFPETLRRPSDG